MTRFLMLVSARADRELRDAVRDGRRPCPEYLRLEERHGVELLDWSRLGPSATRRSARLSIAHTRSAIAGLRGAGAVFSDGEHVGVPLALALLARRDPTPHLVLGHHLTTRAKRPLFRLVRPQARMSRVLVHSSRQLELAVAELGIPRNRLALLPYHADADFWAPRPDREAAEGLVLAVGREHRDYATLAGACADLPVRVHVAAGSLFSPGARRHEPQAWPDNFTVGFADHLALRELYARAAVVAVPLVPTDFQAGVTSILEAMAMATPVVVTATRGQRDIVEDGVTGLMVPPGDAGALREAIAGLLANPRERRRLGDNAREAVRHRFGLDAYTDELFRHLVEIAGPTPTGAPVAGRREGGGGASPLSRADRDVHPMHILGRRN
jgi:glycosyltransferase involved in cell wall biosynthesis